MVNTIFDIAKRFQDKIESDVDYANRFESRFRTNFLARDAISSEMLGNRQNEIESQFNIQDLNQNFGTRLEASRLEAQLDLLNNQNNVSTFAERAALEAKKRAIASRQAQFDIDNFDNVARLEEARIEAQIADQETRLEALTNDRTYEEMRNSIEGIDEMDSVPKFETLFDMANRRKVNSNIRKRIETEMLSEMEDELTAIAKFNDLVVEPVGAPGSAQNIRFQKAVRSFVLNYGRVDEELLRLAITKNVISENDVHPVLLQILNGELTSEQALEGVSAENGFSDVEPDVAGEVNPLGDVPPFPEEELASPEPTQPTESLTPIDQNDTLVGVDSEIRTGVLNIVETPVQELENLQGSVDVLNAYLGRFAGSIDDSEVVVILNKLERIQKEREEGTDSLETFEVERDRLLEVAIAITQDQNFENSDVADLALFYLDNKDKFQPNVKSFIEEALSKYNESKR